MNRLTNTGPTSATLSPMVVDLCFGGQAWGKLQLPEITTSSSGTDIICTEQEIKITNQDSFRAFVKALMLDDELTLSLDNGDCHISSKIMGMTLKSTIVYKQDLVIRGMGGPKVSLVDTSAGKNTIKVANPSPLELDHGVSMFDIVDAASGDAVASLKGQLTIVRGSFDATLDITFQGKKVAPDAKLRLVGKGTEKQSWMNDTLQYINQDLAATPQFASLSG